MNDIPLNNIIVSYFPSKESNSTKELSVGEVKIRDVYEK